LNLLAPINSAAHFNNLRPFINYEAGLLMLFRVRKGHAKRATFSPDKGAPRSCSKANFTSIVAVCPTPLTPSSSSIIYFTFQKVENRIKKLMVASKINLVFGFLPTKFTDF
jgi:hypothetical protein